MVLPRLRVMDEDAEVKAWTGAKRITSEVKGEGSVHWGGMYPVAPRRVLRSEAEMIDSWFNCQRMVQWC
uniref:Uncharacterized protein n=1 Tax=Knipowitschia caucasica TaxID=637954 RepID=A0AAV2KUW2_KNICA